MTYFLWLGTGIGALVGLINMMILIWLRMQQPKLNLIKTLWQALWVWLLWTVFGAYVLAAWIIGLILLGSARLFSERRAAA